MTIEQSIYSLASTWNNRVDAYKHDPSEYSIGYRDALLECTNDLLSLPGFKDALLSPAPPQEVQYYLESQEADNYLSSMEAHGMAV